MCRNINFWDDIDSISCGHLLEVAEFFFGVGTIFGCESRKTVAFQSEGGVCFVPVIIEKLNETIIIQMYLQFIHFIERENFYVILQIVHCEKFPGYVNHQSAVSILRIIQCFSFHESKRLVMDHLQQCASSPEYSFYGGGFDGYMVAYIQFIAFFSQ